MKMPKQKRGKSKQDYQTPPEFIEAVERVYGWIGFDLAADDDGKNAVGDNWFGPTINSLHEEWPCDVVCWLNPPFANIKPWARKCSEEQVLLRTGLILLLTPLVGGKYYQNYIRPYAFTRRLHPRIRFVGEKAPYPKDLMLSVYYPREMGVVGDSVWSWKEAV